MDRLLRVLAVVGCLFVIHASQSTAAARVMMGCNEYSCEWCFNVNNAGSCRCFPEDDLMCDQDYCFQCRCQDGGSCAFFPI